MLAVGRLVSGFPHGAFFGVGRDYPVEARPSGKSHRRRRGHDFGMTVANLVGIPVGTG